MKNYSLISKVTLWVLLAIGLIISAMVFLGGNEAVGLEVAGDELAVPKFTNLFLNWNYILFGIAVLVTLVFVVAGFCRQFKADKKKALFTLCVLIAFVLLFVICWFLGSPEKIQIIGYEGTDNQGFWAQLSDMMMFASYALVCGVILGSIAALRRNKLIDRIIMIITTAFVSMPSFIMGSLFLILFAIKLGIFPANGAAKNGLVLPVITLSLYPMAYITRLTRSSMLEVLGQDYIRTAKAKGVSGMKIIFGHALKNSLIPVITYFGPMLAGITTGSLVVEQIFAVPGIGRAFVNSITGRDYPLVMGTTIVLATLIVIMNLIGDILYKVVDPRITLE